MKHFASGANWLWDRTLNSVVFGIVTMVLIAAYVAIGSGFPSLRAYFEMSDLQFFNAWPMRVLAVLFALNMATVTIGRIPLTLPRLGVWMIHTGAIALVFGMVYYFKHKVEGLTLVRTGETVGSFYDSEERSLYVKVGRRKAIPTPLPDLPRFTAYAPQHGNEDRLGGSLQNLTPTIWNYNEQTRAGEAVPALEAMGFDGPPLSVDLLAFYPYALVGRSYDEADTGGEVGLKMTVRDPVTGESAVRWIVAAYDEDDEESAATIRLRHLHRDDDLTGEGLLAAAEQSHEISWSIGDASGIINAYPGTKHTLGDTGYEVEALEFLPAFPMFGTGEPADMLELLVHPPADSPHGKTFRRYVLDGSEIETDFVLGVEGSGPKGQRQTERVDPGLHLHYVHSDGLQLLPRGTETERQVYLSKPDVPGFWRLTTTNTTPPVLEREEDGRVHLLLQGQRVDPNSGQAMPYNLELDVERVEHVKRQEWVQEVPPEQRDREAGMAGAFQVVTARVTRGDWQQIVHVPFTQWVDQQPWQFGQLNIPGVDEVVQLQLAGTRRDLPGTVVLDEFELVPYAGDFTSTSAMRDFRSHLTVTPRGQEAREVTVQLNEPVYVRVDLPGPAGKVLPGESWLMYQNQWDPENQSFTVLGVGNRPGIITMIVGCVLMVFGIAWAFYLKPIILQRRKDKALALHQAKLSRN